MRVTRTALTWKRQYALIRCDGGKPVRDVIRKIFGLASEDSDRLLKGLIAFMMVSEPVEAEEDDQRGSFQRAYRRVEEELRRTPYDEDELFIILSSLFRNRRSTYSMIYEAVDKLVASPRSVEIKMTELSRDIHAYLSVASLGIDFANARINRYIPVSIYISNDSFYSEGMVKSSLFEILDNLNFDITDEVESRRESWYEKWFAKSRDAITSDEFKKRMEEAEHAVKLAAIGLKQAEIDSQKAQSVSKLIDALVDVENGVIRIGSLVVIKISDASGHKVMAMDLNINQMIELEKNPRLLGSPGALAQFLEASASASQRAIPETITEDAPASDPDEKTVT